MPLNLMVHLIPRVGPLLCMYMHVLCWPEILCFVCSPTIPKMKMNDVRQRFNPWRLNANIQISLQPWSPYISCQACLEGMSNVLYVAVWTPTGHWTSTRRLTTAGRIWLHTKLNFLCGSFSLISWRVMLASW